MVSLRQLVCLALCVFLFASSLQATEDIAAVFPWRVIMEDDASYDLPAIRRGESVIMQPTFYNDGVVKDLSAAHLVIFRYRPKAWAPGTESVITGSVVNATNGTIQAKWTSANEFTNNTYVYEFAVQSTVSMMVRCAGEFSLSPGIGGAGSTNVTPISIWSIDWALVDNNNIGSAPFLSTFQIADIQDELDTFGDGTGDLYVHSVTSATPYQGSAELLTDFPAILARVGDLTPNSVTNLSRGDDEAVGRVERLDAHNVTLHFPIVGEGEIQTTNRLYWTVDGQAIGYVATNGIVMLKGSLQLFEEDLNCNVRAYDGSATAPSVTFYGSPDIGWYRKSTAGSYAWAYTHNSNTVGWINDAGFTLQGTRSFIGYGTDLSFCDVASEYRVGGVHGGTTNINVIVPGGSTQTLHFVGGILTIP